MVSILTQVVDPVSIKSLNITLSVMSLSVHNGTISLEDSSGNTLFTAVRKFIFKFRAHMHYFYKSSNIYFLGI